jgi:hypothetical protein
MPPPDDLRDRVADAIGALRLKHFTASKSQIFAGESVTLDWDVDFGESDSEVPIGIMLNGASVPSSATRSVRPGRDVGYRLTASGAGISRVLGHVAIQVDQNMCQQIEIQEEALAFAIISGVRLSIEQYNADPNNDNTIAFRRATTAEIEPDGIAIRMRLSIAVDNFFNPDVDIDAKIAVGVSSEGQPLAWYSSFSTDVNWPWWVTGMTLGITKIIEHFKSSTVEDKIKPRMLATFHSQLDAQIRVLSGVVSAVETFQDRIVVTVCSAPTPGQRFMSNPGGGVFSPG